MPNINKEAIFAAIGEELPNMDCFVAPDTLEEVRAELKLIRSHISNVLDDMMVYAITKRDAMRCRLEGRISRATEMEADCEKVYRRLPKWARW